MELSTYIARLRQEVAAATELGGPEVVAGADRLLLALEPAVRLTLMEAITDAAAEISAELPAGNVDTRLRGRGVEFVVESIAPAEDEPESRGPADTEVEDSGAQVRITLRLPENLKVRAEELATETGTSLNSWLVEAVRTATRGSGIHLGGTGWSVDLPNIPGFTPPAPPTPPGRPGQPRGRSRRVTGWA
ncbi:pilus assembly protein HicB [Ornithinicoccus hortensis]|uniref:HicB-like protein involved in pilus formation n=1 Tax=Ornithinicoccus hortensis TaxID=82346 RepID=A0A542YPM2_9MICO|nr:pilus assembly protein HicB [Ornithinicoccus hortensis]TQL49874.1 hypothetical protein FB467_0970 [Ornithinicoccus hortensis]